VRRAGSVHPLPGSDAWYVGVCRRIWLAAGAGAASRGARSLPTATTGSACFPPPGAL
jgi:hypothetical protein